MSIDQIVEDLQSAGRLDSAMERVLAKRFTFSELATEEDREFNTKTGFNPYAHEYIAFGRWIRNSYGMWDPQNPYTSSEAGTDDIKHPDNMSGEVLERLMSFYENKLRD